jgi:hypothetical protein
MRRTEHLDRSRTVLPAQLPALPREDVFGVLTLQDLVGLWTALVVTRREDATGAVQARTRTFAAWRPFAPFSTSNSTLWPSSRDL